MTLYYLKRSGAVLALPVAVLLNLSGCGSEEPAASASAVVPSSAAQLSATTAPESVQLDLSSDPIDRADFLGLNPPKILEPEPCPFLSDETALNTAKRTDKLVRRNTSNRECYWSRNLGFSIKVSVEPLASAKPLKDRAYNIDSLPIFQAQTGPGSNAMVLLDTVWDKAGRPYAIGFEQDQHLVTIYVTGLNTDIERLLATANEVSEKLPTAPKIVDHVMNPARFDLCSVWSEQSISAALGSAVTVVKADDACTWKSDDAAIQFGLFYGGNFPFDSLIEQGATELENLGVRAVIRKQRKKGSRPSAFVLDVTLGDAKKVTLSISDSVAGSDAIAIALVQNLTSRLN